MKNSILKSYVALVVVAAAGLAGWLGGNAALAVNGGLLTILMWTFVAGSQSVAFPKHRVQLTAADCFLFYALVTHGALGAMLAAFVGTLGAMQLGQRKLTPHQAAFNLGVVPLAAGLGGHLFETLREGSNMIPAMLAAAATFAVTNTLLVCVVLKIENKVPLGRTLRATIPGFAISVLVTSIAGGLLAQVAMRGPGEWTVAAAVSICFLFGATISTFRKRMDGNTADPTLLQSKTADSSSSTPLPPSAHRDQPAAGASEPAAPDRSKPATPVGQKPT